MTIPRLIITLGEPAGIGPDVTAQIAQQDWPAELIVVGDPELLASRAKLLQLPLSLEPANFDQPAVTHTPGTLKYIPVALVEPAQPGILNPKNADYVLQTLRIAADVCLAKKAAAVVTAPVHKGIINQAGVKFKGHTEFFAEHCGVEKTVMLFAVDKLFVALATTHIPLSQVSSAINQPDLEQTLRILQQGLKQQFHLSNPRILVCGLNPHAGENGYLGREEIDVIQPVIAKLQNEGLQISGPYAADTIFTEKYLNQADAILALYHDQGLPVVKYLGFGNAVNVTLGLPFVRTSVDHGTALDIAGSGMADAGSLTAAIKLALSEPRA